MNLIIITDMFRDVKNDIRGIFIYRRLKEYRKMNIHYSIYAPVLYDSFALNIAKGLLRRRKREPSIPPAGDEVKPIKNYRTLKEAIIKFISQEKYLLTIARKFAKKIFEKVRNYNLDVISAHGMYTHIGGGAGTVALFLSDMLDVPYIITLHGSDVNYEMEKNLTLFLKVLKNAAKVIFVSRALKKRAMKLGYSGDNAVVIPNGYDPSIFHPMNKEEIRKKLGIYRENTNYVGFVGNLIPIKRADKFPEIFHYIAKEIEEVIFIVVGDGTLKKEVEEKTRDLKVIFTGRLPQKEVAEWMNAMDVMILPSRNEGFGTVAIEAQACGTAVVGSSNGGIPEAIGFEEFVVEEGEDFEKRFAKRVVEVLEKRYERKKLLERAKGFTWENIVKREVEVYKEILQMKLE